MLRCRWLLPESLIHRLLDAGRLFLGDITVRKQLADHFLIQKEHILVRIMGLSILIDHVTQVLLHIKKHFIGMLILCPENVTHDGMERHLLLRCRALDAAAQSVCHKLGMWLLCILCIEKR